MRLTSTLALLLLLPVAASAGRAKPSSKTPRKTAAPGSGPDLPSRFSGGSPFCTVNGQPIPVSAYVDRLSIAYGPPVREMLIDEALVRQEAQKRKITAGAAEVDAVVAQGYAATVRQPPYYGDEKRLVEELKRSRGWTPDDYRVVLRLQAEPQVLRTKIAASLVAPGAVADKEVEARYEQGKERQFTQPETVRISHILVRLPEDEKVSAEEKDRSARTRAETLLKKLRAASGANFEQVAKESSDDRITGAQGGKLPTPVARGANPYGAEWDRIVFAAPVGLIDQVVPSPLGYYLVRVEAKTPGRVLPLAEIREQLRESLLAERRAQALDELFVRLRTQAKIDTGKF